MKSEQFVDELLRHEHECARTAALAYVMSLVKRDEESSRCLLLDASYRCGRFSAFKEVLG